MSELDKYWVITAGDITELNNKITKFDKQGYKLLGPATPYNGIGGSCWVATLYLSSTPNIEEYEKFRNIDIGSSDQEVAEAKGFTPLASYSKHITWAIHKKPQPRLSIIRELLVQIGSIAEDADHKDPSILDQIYRLSDKALSEIDEPRDTAIQG